MPVSRSSISTPMLERPAIKALASGVPGKDQLVGIRPDPAEQRRPQNETRQQIADDGRKADALHDLAQRATDEQQQNDLGNENDLTDAAKTVSAASGA